MTHRFADDRVAIGSRWTRLLRAARGKQWSVIEWSTVTMAGSVGAIAAVIVLGEAIRMVAFMATMLYSLIVAIWGLF